MLAGRDFLSISDLSRDEIQSLMDLAVRLKSDSRQGPVEHRLSGKVIGLLFEKPSTRTRASFETAVYQLGGQAMYLRADELQLSRGEPLKDTARILGSYLNGVVIRTYAHQNLVEFAEYAPVTIINALSDLEHPTQIIADMLTVIEAKGVLQGVKFVWVGDGNNVCNSWLLGATTMGMNMVVSCPKGYEPNKQIHEKAKELAKESGGNVSLVRDPLKAVEGADVIYTDVWVSMGQDKEARKKERAFKSYQINSKLVSKAKPDVAVMHCLPAHRGLEITDDVLEGPRSIVWKQGENKLHGARAVLAAFLGGP
ncbi:MAG: ornithine carbamoyltransferase [Candidatus Bathyarchaeia archaeon]|jgi:ornithine carbamoyltransferase